MPLSDRQKQDEKRRRYMRSIGKPATALPHEYEEAVTKLHSFRARGMTLDAMEAASGHAVNGKAFSMLLCGNQDGMYRTTYDAVMAMPFVPWSWRSGARTPCVGATRRLQALRLKGFPLKGILAEMLEMDVWNVQQLAHGRRKFIFYNTHVKVAQVYDKLAWADPVDHGIKPEHSLKAIAYTRGKGWGTVDCWDEDTIDDPDAVPEWTGACGTAEGYTIHVRETFVEGNHLPLCDACKRATEHTSAESPKGVQRIRFHSGRFAELLKERGLTVSKLAAMPGVFVSEETLYKWRAGGRTPQDMGRVLALASALECPVGELAEMHTTAAYDGPVRRGEFNRHLFRSVLEVTGTSWNQAARIGGVSPATVQNWIRGKSKPGAAGRNQPNDRQRLTPFADHFGVDVEVFFS